VCIAARSPEKNAAALAELAQFGTRVDALTCDVTAEDQIAGAMVRITRSTVPRAATL
jgi:NAD(P)-dependent dehydrogenase (short-subunit alcohol dehydrogenase family)